MKQDPKTEKLESVLKSSHIVAHGFMGDDKRHINEIIEADIMALEKLGLDVENLAQRMQQITDQAIKGLGSWVKINDNLSSRVDEAKGAIVCPWPHAGKFVKRITILKNEVTGLSISWSDLSIHMIKEHCFFEGKGSMLRVEPEMLVDMIF